MTSHHPLTASNERGTRAPSSSLFGRTLLRACTALALLVPSLAHGEPSAALPLDVDPSLTRIDEEALRTQIHEQLDLSSLSNADERLGTLLVRNEGEQVAVVFVTKDGRVISRKVDLPDDPELASRTLAFAASNLVRDEASEILASLAPLPAPEPEPVSEPEPPPPPASTPSGSPIAPFNPCARATIPVGVDFAPFVGTSSAAPDAVRGFSLNFAGGYAKGLNGFELGIGANIESDFACGVQIAAGANIVSGPVHGLQLASLNIAGPVRGAQIGVVGISSGDVAGSQIGVLTIAGGSVRGAQIGVVGVTGDSVRGTQIGVLGITGGDVKGSQLGVAHIAGGSVDGSQIGVANIVGGDAKRFQMGVLNLTGGNVDGFEIGVANIVGGNVDGVQLGVANITGGDVGTQIGVFNYADDSDVSIGILNVIRRGRTSIEAWGTADGMASIGIRHGGRHVHNIIGAGIPFGNENSSWGFTLGFGTRLPLADKLHLDIDLLSTIFANRKGNPFTDDGMSSNYRLLFDFGYEIADRFGIFGGPSVDVLVSDKDRSLHAPPWGSIALHDGNTRVHITPGLTLGARYDVQKGR